jgi:DnaJ-class molecular chaperone
LYLYNKADGAPAVRCPSDISKGYRSISKFVHPDKNPHPMAREAFEALNLAVRTLRDPTQLVAPLTL